MRKLIGILGLALAALLSLSACGGGGGSSGNTTERYSITLRADRTSLPLNIMNLPPALGPDAPYTTTLYVNAKEGSDPIQDSADATVFGCNISSGLASGSLVYLDGEHNDATTGAETLYRQVALSSNAGGNSFHFHAGSQAGVAHITCTITDPRDSRVYSASVDITVGGGGGTGLPASMMAVALEPGYLGVQDNLANLRSSIVMQTQVWDDAGQPVPDPVAPNLQVSIIGGTAAAGAYLLSGSEYGSSIQVKTVGGVAQIGLSSGWTSGSILLELKTDRADNNVANGIQSAVPVRLLHRVDVFDAVDQALLVVAPDPAITGNQGESVAGMVSATGGVPPYVWAAGPLSNGLSISSDGIISGVAQSPGTFIERVSVTDQLNNTATGYVTITIAAKAPVVIVIQNANITGTVGVPLSYAFSVSGGGGTPPYTWTALGTAPPGLNFNGGSTGVLSGTPTAAGTYTFAVQVTDSNGVTATQNATVTIAAAP